MGGKVFLSLFVGSLSHLVLIFSFAVTFWWFTVSFGFDFLICFIYYSASSKHL
jgi:hypothetical protein